MRTLGISLLVAFYCMIAHRASAQIVDTKGIEFFEQRIRPVLAEHCFRCHSAEARQNRKLKAKLLLDTKEGMRQGGDSGPAVVAGKPKESLLLKALRHEGAEQMPPSGKLTPAVLADFETWIKLGAPDPRDGAQPASIGAAIDWTKARQFWAFRPPLKHSRPKVKNSSWSKRDIDYFILAELEKHDLKPVALATKRDLVRRATFDLIGLPPTPGEIDTFLKDESDDAFAKVVERLLASPHYGERWGRYWLDVARYAEDKALAFANTAPHAFRYRDWVVRAINDDMPYDRFVRLQIAGDLVTDAEPDYFVKLAGLGFQGLGQEYHRGSVAAQVMADELDDRIDTLSRGLLGLTVSCARCHDHKYDPIPTRDYYSLAAAYNGSRLQAIALADEQTVARRKEWEKKSKEMDAKLKAWVNDQTRDTIKAAVADAGHYLEAAWQIRVARQSKLIGDSGTIATREKLHAFFLVRAVKFLEQGTFDGQDPAVKAWLAAMTKTGVTAAPMAAGVPVELRKATKDLGSAIRLALTHKEDKNPPNLLKTLWLNPNAIFFVSDKEAPQLLNASSRAEYADRHANYDRLQRESPPEPALAHAVVGGGSATPIYIRGNVERVGEMAPPGFLQVLTAPTTARLAKFTRLELAEAITSPKNPLTARVIVNRVWYYHFGRGIVGTTSNFGQNGDRPTHTELLDTLAVRFMKAGWSLRWLHREMMLSTTYQLAGSNVPPNAERDPDNHYHWRHTPHRLDFEAWRDAWLAVSGRLDPARGGPSIDLGQADNVRRTIYAKVSRLEPNKLMILFDFPDANVTSDRRGVTTVPQQQLFALNSEFAIETAKALARRLEKAGPQAEDRIMLAFRLAYGREPESGEMRASLEFVHAPRTTSAQDRLTPWEQFAHAILAANEFMWID